MRHRARLGGSVTSNAYTARPPRRIVGKDHHLAGCRVLVGADRAVEEVVALRAVKLADGVEGYRTSGSFSRSRFSVPKCSGATNAHNSLPAPVPRLLAVDGAQHAVVGPVEHDDLVARCRSRSSSDGRECSTSPWIDGSVTAESTRGGVVNWSFARREFATLPAATFSSPRIQLIRSSFVASEQRELSAVFVPNRANRTCSPLPPRQGRLSPHHPRRCRPAGSCRRRGVRRCAATARCRPFPPADHPASRCSILAAGRGFALIQNGLSCVQKLVAVSLMKPVTLTPPDCHPRRRVPGCCAYVVLELVLLQVADPARQSVPVRTEHPDEHLVQVGALCVRRGRKGRRRERAVAGADLIQGVSSRPGRS